MQERGKRKSAARLRRELELPVSLPTVLKILREEGLYFWPATVRTGAVFVAYAREKSLTHTTLFLVHLHRHFQEYGIYLSGSGNQTDNSTEFTAPWNSRKVTLFTRVVETCLGATH